MQKEVIFPKEKAEFIFPIADGRIKTLGGDQDLKTSTLIREEDQRDFLGESAGSPPPLLQDSLPDAGDTKWFLVHVRTLHIPPSRWIQSQILLAEKRIIPYSSKIHWRLQNDKNEFECYARKPHRDFWFIDGSRDLSDSWTGFTQSSLLEEKPPDGYMWFRGRLTKRQVTSRPDHLWPELWIKLGRNVQLKER